MPSPQVPTQEPRGDGGDVPKTGWREEKFDAALASQSARGWGLSLWRCGRCVASHSALDWGDSPLSVAGRLPWRVSPRLIGDCREVASQSALDWGLWRCGRCVASQSALDWGDSPLSVAGRCLGESMYARGWG